MAIPTAQEVQAYVSAYLAAILPLHHDSSHQPDCVIICQEYETLILLFKFILCYFSNSAAVAT